MSDGWEVLEAGGVTIGKYPVPPVTDEIRPVVAAWFFDNHLSCDNENPCWDDCYQTTVAEPTDALLAGLAPAVAAMRDRWVAQEIARLAEYADAEDGFALNCAQALMDRWADDDGQAVHIHADPRTVVQVVLRALAAQYRREDTR